MSQRTLPAGFIAPCLPSASRHRSSRSPDWLKMKNSNAPAVKREAEEDWAEAVVLEPAPRTQRSVMVELPNCLLPLLHLTEQELDYIIIALVASRADYRALPREREPRQWARTQYALGLALLRLGERESGTARLEEAVA